MTPALLWRTAPVSSGFFPGGEDRQALGAWTPGDSAAEPAAAPRYPKASPAWPACGLGATSFHFLVPSPRLHSLSASPPESKTYRGKVVSSQDPRTKAGLYWGYTVRLASCLSKDRASSCEYPSSLSGRPQRTLLDPKVRPGSQPYSLAVRLGQVPFLLWALVSLSALPGMLLRTSEEKRL